MSAADGPVAKLKALQREAAKLAIPLFHGLNGLDRDDVEERLMHLAESHGLPEALTRGTVEFAVVNALKPRAHSGGPFDDVPFDDPPDDGWQPPTDNPRDLDGSKLIPSRKALTVFPLVAFKDIQLDLQSRNYLVKGLLPRAGIAVIWGPPKCYKTFWATDLGLHIALGWKYRGQCVQQAPVVYVALEGRAGLPARKEAFARHHGIEEAPFYLMTTPLNLAMQADALVASIEAQLGDVKPGAVFIDTLNRSLVGSESKDEDMAAYLAGAGKIEQKFGCLVAIVHHCGIDASRPRGHTSLQGAVEVQLKVERVGDLQVIVTVELAKDFAEGAQLASRLEPVELCIDNDGDKVTSLVVLAADPATRLVAKSRDNKKARTSKSQRAIQDAITEALDDCGRTITPRAGMASMRAVKVIDVKKEFERRYVVPDADPARAENAKRMAFSRALEHLPSAKFATGSADGADWIWKIT